MSKHTPGPWTFGHWGDDFWVSPDSSGLTQKVARVTWGMGEERKEGRENARLIAAAPELLEALSGLVDACEAHNSANGREMVDRHALERARAAIAKAEGR
jgi:hypothetical protein